MSYITCIYVLKTELCLVYLSHISRWWMVDDFGNTGGDKEGQQSAITEVTELNTEFQWSWALNFECKYGLTHLFYASQYVLKTWRHRQGVILCIFEGSKAYIFLARGRHRIRKLLLYIYRYQSSSICASCHNHLIIKNNRQFDW